MVARSVQPWFAPVGPRAHRGVRERKHHKVKEPFLADPAPVPEPDASKSRDYDPAAAYDELIALIQPTREQDRAKGRRGGGRSDSDEGNVYQQLMARERRVLDTVDRVVNDRARARTEETSIVGKSVGQHWAALVGTARGLLDDLTAARHIRDVLTALLREDRRFYLGVALVLLAVACLLLEHA